MRKGLLKSSIAALAATVIGLSTLSSISIIKANAAVNNLDFGAGQGGQFPDQLCAPYADMVDYYEVPGYTNNGVLYLPKIMEDTGIKYYNLAFIQSAGGTEGGKVKWGWGGHGVLSESSTDKWQYSGIIKSIKDLREKGGDVIVSFGGAAGTAFWQTTQDVNVLTNTYMEIVDGYNLTRIDLDVEGGAMSKTQNIANAKAIKNVQDATGVEVTLTLPVLPSGLDSMGVGVLEAYLSQGVKIKMVNIMAMCYGNGVLLPGENYGTASVRAIDSTMKQVQEYFKKHQNITLTEEQAYALVGVTPSVGFEGSNYPVFPPEWSKLVTDHAISKKLAMTSFWSMNRDSMLQKNSGINAKYEHSKEYNKFPGNQGPVENAKPVLSGVENKTINVGQSFNNMDGVKAIDREDGDITNKITVTGSVNTSIEGNYTLNYSVTDSKDATTTATRVITVVKDTPVNNKPVINGATNKTINVGTAFDPKAGVTANDAEDGDLTSKIVISGSVNTEVAGSYQITYSVKDSTGATATVAVTITVKELPAKTEDVNGDGKVDVADLALVASKYNMTSSDVAYDAKCDINSDGIIDIYDLTKVSKKIGSSDGGQTVQEWKVGVAYNVGDKVTYQGKTYKCLIGHTAHAGWVPGAAFVVWEEVK